MTGEKRKYTPSKLRWKKTWFWSWCAASACSLKRNKNGCNRRMDGHYCAQAAKTLCTGHCVFNLVFANATSICIGCPFVWVRVACKLHKCILPSKWMAFNANYFDTSAMKCSRRAFIAIICCYLLSAWLLIITFTIEDMHVGPLFKWPMSHHFHS